MAGRRALAVNMIYWQNIGTVKSYRSIALYPSLCVPPWPSACAAPGGGGAGWEGKSTSSAEALARLQLPQPLFLLYDREQSRIFRHM